VVTGAIRTSNAVVDGNITVNNNVECFGGLAVSGGFQSDSSSAVNGTLTITDELKFLGEVCIDANGTQVNIGKNTSSVSPGGVRVGQDAATNGLNANEIGSGSVANGTGSICIRS